MAFNGLKILCLESRRSADLASLIRRQGGDPTVAPSVKERSVEDHSIAFRLVEQLEAGDFDILICMTGVGLSFLRDVVAPSIDAERLGAAFRRAAVVSRGSKPIPLLRALQVPIAELIPEPNTWREVVTAVSRRIRDFGQTRIAIQEYGRPNLEMNNALESLGATVTPFALYRWELPDDIEPLHNAVLALSQNAFEVVVFTSSIQLDHLFEIAQRLNLSETIHQILATKVVIVSIGPVMSEALRARGIEPDVEPQSPKMGAMVKAASEESAAALQRKLLNL
jgi:uroporphyrinogen-III synthase